MGEKPQNNDTLRWYQRLALELLWGTCCAIGWMPRWVRYGILRSFVYLLLNLIRYRRKVMLSNISLSFPEKSAKEVRAIMRGAYFNLAEVIIDTISLAGAVRRNDLDHVTWIDLDKHIERIKGRDWIFMAAHYSCWEYFPLWCTIDKESHLLCAYHPLKNIVFEHFYRRLRDYAPNVHQVPMLETVRQYIKNRGKGKSVALGLISDQTPNLRPDTEWFDFLNRKTAFIDGSEKLAMRFNIPVYFVHIERVRAGHMAIRLDEIYDGVEEVEPMEITRRYAAALEAMIKERPELWMWSHKRWKHTPEKQLQRFGKITPSGLK